MGQPIERLGLALASVVVAATVASAQQGRGAGPPPPPPTPQAGAPIDLTGYWVSIVNEDWRWRMVTPPKGDYASVPLNPEGRKVADTWEPSQDGSCLAYGAAGVMRMPTRLHITWENEHTLKIETDAGQQTRRLLFDQSAARPTRSSLQGFSLAEWERPTVGRRGGGPGGGPPGPPGASAPAGSGGRAGAPGPVGGNLKVVTTHLSPGWLRKNGVPYSDKTTVTEYFDRFPVGDDQWLVVTTLVSDATYLTQEFITSSHFRREPDGSKWDPTPCRPS
jgi:hypothetical protein